MDHVFAVFLTEVRTGHGPNRLWKGSKDGKPRQCYVYSDSKGTKKETWPNYHTRTCNMARKIWIKMGLPFLYERIAESMWRAMGWVCDEKSNAVINSLKKVYRWRSTRWGHSLQTEMMERDCQNHTRWKHRWEWHNRGNVSDKVATDWAGKEDWMRTRKMKSTLDESTYSSLSSLTE